VVHTVIDHTVIDRAPKENSRSYAPPVPVLDRSSSVKPS